MKTRLLFLSLFFVFFASIKSLAFSGGDGTSSSTPYLISNSADLAELAGNSAYWATGIYFKQTNDIALSGNWTTPIGIASGTKFTGTYDGNGYKITGLNISATAASFGFFGAIGSGGTVRNLGIENASFNANTYGTQGILVGTNNGGVIQNCYATGSISGSAAVYGGLVGNFNTGTLSNCFSSANVSTTSALAGSVIGGLVGQAPYGTIENCYATGSVTNTNGIAGGLLGQAGTLVASTTSVSYCYSTGLVSGTTKGGFIGKYQYGSFTDCFFDQTTSLLSSAAGSGSPTGITAKTTAEMKTQTTFSTWDFTTIWEMIGTNYPRLKAVPDASLPVELTSFTASSSDNKVILNWQTATEVSNYGFEVERASTSLSMTWEKVGFVKGNGNSNAPKEYSFIDNNPGAGKYLYRLKQMDNDGKYTYSKEVDVTFITPTAYALAQNYPNPFNPTTKIEFSIPYDNNVEIKVFNVLGMEVATLLNEQKQAGTHNVEFNASNLASGIYFYKIVSGKYSDIKKMILLR